MLRASGLGEAAELDKAAQENQGLGLFVRSLVGLDRAAAKEAFSGFLSGKSFRGNQIEFINLIVNHLTEQGVMGADLLYESPFIDLAPSGPDGLFSPAQVREKILVVAQVTVLEEPGFCRVISRITDSLNRAAFCPEPSRHRSPPKCALDEWLANGMKTAVSILDQHFTETKCRRRR